jgi:hypothetical protein
MTDSWKPGRGQKIAALYAWVAEEPDGGEGVCSIQMGSLQLPLIGADMDRIKSLRQYAEQARALTKYPIRLVRYAHREDLEELPDVDITIFDVDTEK